MPYINQFLFLSLLVASRYIFLIISRVTRCLWYGPLLREGMRRSSLIRRMPFSSGQRISSTIFPYPPSAVLIFYGLCIGGPAVFMAAWYFLFAAGLIVCLRASLVAERHEA